MRVTYFVPGTHSPEKFNNFVRRSNFTGEWECIRENVEGGGLSLFISRADNLGLLSEITLLNIKF